MACCELKRAAAGHGGARRAILLRTADGGTQRRSAREWNAAVVTTLHEGGLWSEARDRLACCELRGAAAERAGGERSYGLHSARKHVRERRARPRSAWDPARAESTT